ncbi:MAG TPA: NAD(P)/FAD-dependent oxidoreductase [Arcobacter sp.]|nr:NAD(P)/FAD-dependent oxidoreductase [Arcobacter sp.]HIP55555.1 NAD(P)/FAD-dependent oxidoreductase [Arcobacter sp.]
MNKNISIIGAGASGLLSSVILAKKGFNVTVFEKNTKAGRKILATGNGKCNISNENLSMDNFHSSSKDFPTYAINTFTYKKFEEFFNNLGLLLLKGSGTKVYPLSLQASSVSDILYSEALRYGVKFIFNSYIEDIKSQNNIYIIKSNNDTYKCSKLIIASGSSAMKKLGSTSSGYDVAKQYKHKIIEPFASLVQLTSKDNSIYRLSGVKTNSLVKLYVNNKFVEEKSGDILFTNYGLSGNTILDLSRNASYSLQKNKKIQIHIDILPNMSNEYLVNLFNQRKELLKTKEINFLLESLINKKFIPYILNKAYLDRNKIYINQLSKNDISNVINQIKNIKVDINDTKGFDSAEVVAGGIDVRDIDNKTMQSKLQKNLYFCGEVLDVDGACGGYNLHWAWASAFVMSQSINL